MHQPKCCLECCLFQDYERAWVLHRGIDLFQSRYFDKGSYNQAPVMATTNDLQPEAGMKSSADVAQDEHDKEENEGEDEKGDEAVVEEHNEGGAHRDPFVFDDKEKYFPTFILTDVPREVSSSPNENFVL